MLVAAAAAAIWWQGKKGGPEYSLALLAGASRAGDDAAAAEFIDSAAIAESLSGQVTTDLPPPCRHRSGRPRADRPRP